MKTVTIDIINDRAMKLLQELEFLQLIRLHKEKTDSVTANWAERYKGAMSKQPLADVNSQLDELRGEWE